MDNQDEAIETVRQYSVVVGVLLILVFVVPCVVFALVSKYFQKTTRRTRHSVRSLVSGTFRVDTYDEKQTYDFLDSNTSSFGVFGQIDFPVEKIECVEQMVCVKTPLACITTWKAYAPDTLCAGTSDTKKLVTVKKLASYNPQFTSSGSVDSTKESNHTLCLKTELSLLSHIPPHPHLLNLLGVCMSGVIPSAILLEYPPYGSLHSFLVCKRRGRISNNTKPWAGLDSTHEEPSILLGMIDPLPLPLLGDEEIRARPFRLPLNERFSEMDEVLWGMQIASAMEFLISKDIYHKRLCSENVVISAGFFLKLTGVECDTPMLHRNTSTALLKRTPTGRNIRKWEAPEVGSTNVHSAESEVWRFGMLLWEVSSVGDTPFGDIPHRKLTELLKLGEIPHKPEECSEQLYDIMRSCWSVKPEERPSFSTLIQQFQNMATTSKTLPPPIPTLTTYHPSPTASPRHKPVSPMKGLKSCMRRPHVHIQKTTSAVVLLMDPPSPDEIPGYHETDV